MFHLQIVSTVESAQRNFRFLQFHKGRTNLTDMIIPVDQKYIFFLVKPANQKTELSTRLSSSRCPEGKALQVELS